MPKAYIDTFQKIGLSREEAEIYMSLLSNGNQSASGLAKTTTVKRTYVYAVCKELIEKNLIVQEKHGNTTLFRVLSPDRLQSEAESQKYKAETALGELKSILPGLHSTFTRLEHQPEFIFYEGLDGIKKIYTDVLEEGQHINMLINAAYLTDETYRHFQTLWLKRGLSIRIISFTKPLESQEYPPEGLRIKIAPPDMKQLEEIILLYDHKVVIIKPDIPPNGMILYKAMLANSFRAWFDLTWNVLP